MVEDAWGDNGSAEPERHRSSQNNDLTRMCDQLPISCNAQHMHHA